MKSLMYFAFVLVLVFAFSASSHAAFKAAFDISFADQANPGKDASGNGKDAVLSKTVKWVKADGEGAIECNGTDAYAGVVIDVPEKNFTMGVWIKTAEKNAGVMSVLDGDAGAGGHDRHFFIVNEVVNFRVWQGVAWASTGKVSDNKWHHIALSVADKTGQVAYVDGKEVGKNVYDHSDFDWQKRVWIGFSNDVAPNYFKGLIKKAVYLSQALTAAEVQTLYTSQSTAVEPASKLITTWSNIKTSY